MREAVQNMFDKITMPEACVEKTKEAMMQMEHKKNRKNWNMRPAVTAAALAAVVLIAGLMMNTEVRAAVSELVRYVIRDSTFTRQEDGELLEFSQEAGDTAPVFIDAGDGKMYFSAFGQYVDITDKTSMEKPYIYTFVDEENVEHMIAIGGSADNFGVMEFYRELVEGQPKWGGWIGGYSENYVDNQTGKAYPWVAAAWEELDLPWPMPE